jgi:hypothetical protein
MRSSEFSKAFAQQFFWVGKQDGWGSYKGMP